MNKKVPQKAKRRFSKAITALSLLLAWALAFVSTFQGLGNVAVASVALVITLIGNYTAIGAIDFKTQMNALKELTNGDDYPTDYTEISGDSGYLSDSDSSDSGSEPLDKQEG